MEDTKTEQNQSPTIGKLALALSKAQGMMTGAVKDSENPFFKSKYADLNSCLEAARGPLSKNDLAVIQTTSSNDKKVTIITTLAHGSGEWIRGSLEMTPKKDDDQGKGSSITYGRRYGFAAIVGLAQKDDDGNESSKENRIKKQPKQESQPEDRTHVDQWLTWIEKFAKDKANADVFEAAYNKSLLPSLGKFPKQHKNELEIAYKATLVYLQEENNG